jgi:hypothetical protein
MQQELFQLYDTDIWGSHASRTNLGVFSSVHEALYSLVRNPQTDEADLDRLKAIFKNDNRLFVEKITLNEVEGYSQVFDSENDDCLDELKKIIFFESIEKHKNDLGFLAVDDEEIPFDIHAIESVDDVTDNMIEEYLNEDNAVKFIKEVFKS